MSQHNKLACFDLSLSIYLIKIDRFKELPFINKILLPFKVTGEKTCNVDDLCPCCGLKGLSGVISPI